jgi:hypothetical protein
MSFLEKIKEDVFNDLLTTTFPLLKDKLKKVFYEDEDGEFLLFQKYFGLNQYNKDLSEIYLIDRDKNKKQLNYYLISEDIYKIKFYNKSIVLIDIEGEKRLFKQNYYYKYYYLFNTLNKLFNNNYNIECYYKELDI